MEIFLCQSLFYVHSLCWMIIWWGRGCFSGECPGSQNLLWIFPNLLPNYVSYTLVVVRSVACLFHCCPPCFGILSRGVFVRSFRHFSIANTPMSATPPLAKFVLFDQASSAVTRCLWCGIWWGAHPHQKRSLLWACSDGIFYSWMSTYTLPLISCISPPGALEKCHTPIGTKAVDTFFFIFFDENQNRVGCWLLSKLMEIFFMSIIFFYVYRCSKLGLIVF